MEGWSTLCHGRVLFNNTTVDTPRAAAVRVREMNRLLSRVTYEICDLHVMRRILRKTWVCAAAARLEPLRARLTSQTRARFSIRL